jgi:hypothetical protein
VVVLIPLYDRSNSNATRSQAKQPAGTVKIGPGTDGNNSQEVRIIAAVSPWDELFLVSAYIGLNNPAYFFSNDVLSSLHISGRGPPVAYQLRRMTRGHTDPACS